jgi:hypothetical protein
MANGEDTQSLHDRILCLSPRPRRAPLASARGMYWALSSACLRGARTVAGVARARRASDFTHLPCRVFCAATPLFSLPLASPAPSAARISSRYVLGAFEFGFARGADCFWCCPGSARVRFHPPFLQCVLRLRPPFFPCLSLRPRRAPIASPRGMYWAHFGRMVVLPGLGAHPIAAESVAKFDVSYFSSLCFSE